VVSEYDIPEREFYDVFDSVHECLLAAFDQGLARVSRLVEEAAKCAQGWHERMRAALSALLVFFDEEPGWARLLLCELHIDAADDDGRRQQTLRTLARALETGAQVEASSASWFVPWPELTAELVVGGVVAVLRKRVLEGSHEPFVELAPSLMAFIMAQYPGSSTKLTEDGTRAANDLESRPRRLPVRVTYRTTRVLKAISDAAGLSNRDIAEAAGLTDEGQTSRLLRRLEERGLVQNVGVGHTYGGANAWLLTPYGERVLEATRHSLVPGAGAVMGGRVRGAA
jgi:DNA-binding MarR family transcriptional regulator